MFPLGKFLSERQGKRCSQCIFVLFILVFVQVMLWKFHFVTWNVHMNFSIGENYLKLSKSLVSRDRKPSTKKDVKGFYTLVETVNPAVAWQRVVFRILPNSSNDVKVGHSTFWGRATHEQEVAELNIRHVGNDVYEAEFIPTFGGVYKVVLLLTFINGEQFKYFARHVKARLVDVTGSPFFLVVQTRPPPENVTRHCSQSESGTVQGRWVKCGSLRGVERCGTWQLAPRYDFDKRHGYSWQPYTCQLHYYTNNEMKKCLAKNGWERIVLTGDSHSRFRTYHWATRLYGACPNCRVNHVKTSFDHVPKMEWLFDARGTRWPATFPKSVRRPNEIYIEHKTRRSMFSDGLPNSTLDGDLYLMNFGHWLLREMTFETFMAKKVAAFVQAVKLMNHTRGTSRPKAKTPKRFLWVNTLSLKWREDIHVYNWTMTPAPSTTSYINSFLDQRMKDAGIQVVNAHQISNPRVSAVHDATHYAKVFSDGICAGVVENAVTNVILNALCNEIGQ